MKFCEINIDYLDQYAEVRDSSSSSLTKPYMDYIKQKLLPKKTRHKKSRNTEKK